MRLINKVLIGVISTGGILGATIGTGAGATFNDAVHGTQTVKAGTLKMTVTGPSGSTTDGKTVTLADFGPTNSTFTTGPQLITTTNSGDITASSILLSASDTNTNATFQSQLYVEIDSWTQPNQGGSLVVAYNGPLSGLEAHPQAIAGPVKAGETDPFYVTFYAGNNGANTDKAGDVGYGSNLDNAPSLTNDAEGGTVTPSITVAYTG